ncbi:unnamed protein product [Lampetra fluviatilis]
MGPKRRAAKKSTRAQKSGLSISNDVTREHNKMKQEKLAGFIADFGLAVEEHLAMITNVLNSYLVQVDKAHINLLMKAPGSLLNTNYLKFKAELLPSSKAGGGQGSKLILTVKRRPAKKAMNMTEMKTRLTSQSIKKRTSERLLKARVTPVSSKERFLVPNSTSLTTSMKKYRFSSSMAWTSGVQISQNGEPFNHQPSINLPLADGQDYVNSICSQVTALTNPESRPGAP